MAQSGVSALPLRGFAPNSLASSVMTKGKPPILLLSFITVKVVRILPPFHVSAGKTDELKCLE